MSTLRDLAHQLDVTGRVIGRALRRRWSDNDDVPPDPAGFRTRLTEWLATLADQAPSQYRFVDLPATRPPWTDSGLDLRAGDSVTWLAHGRVYLSRLLDIWAPPSFQLWGRIGDAGRVFRGTRDTHSFTAAADGRLWLASYYPGEWSTPNGRLRTPVEDYSRVTGALSTLVMVWPRDTDTRSRLRSLGARPDAPEIVKAEAQRLASVNAQPDDWHYLWYLGGGEIYQAASQAGRGPTICCHTHGDVGILQRDTPLALRPGTRLRWSWRVDELPIDLPEDSLPSHDCLSIAVEFDDGQDLTYYWSSSLPVGKAYRCPLPTWKDKETHVVVRSGAADLGRWLDEERDVHEDYTRIIGGPARRVVRVWLIANSLFHRRHGRCEYSNIVVEGPGGSVRAL